MEKYWKQMEEGRRGLRVCREHRAEIIVELMLGLSQPYHDSYAHETSSSLGKGAETKA